MKKDSLPNQAAGLRPGFTLVEMLVVIGIIVLLIGLLLPMLTRAYRDAERTRVAGDLQAISAALEAYKQDLNQYPPVAGKDTGATVLCQALLGPDGVAIDGADGYGFRTRVAVGGVAQSKIYGPYMPPDRVKVSGGTFIDRYRHPILYFPANPGKPNPKNAGGLVSAFAYNTPGAPLFNANDNIGQFGGDVKRIQLMLGDRNVNGAIDAGESARSTGPFLLWSCGPDEQYGPDATLAIDRTVLDSADADKCDDVTNFLP